MEPEEVLEQEPVVEEPTTEPEPMQIYTRGEWALLEKFLQHEFEEGKTYHIKVVGHCQFMVSSEQPTVGITTNEITYTKSGDKKLWIKTGGIK